MCILIKNCILYLFQFISILTFNGFRTSANFKNNGGFCLMCLHLSNVRRNTSDLPCNFLQRPKTFKRNQSHSITIFANQSITLIYSITIFANPQLHCRSVI